MAWDALTTAEIAVGKPVTNALLTKVKDDLDFLYGRVGTLSSAGTVANGSFEIDTDADGAPDNWTMAAYSGGTAAIETTIRSHGDQCMKFVHPGGASNGGGYITSDYVTVGTLYGSTLAWSYYCTDAAMKFTVEAHWYDEAESLLGTTTLYTSTANPTSWAVKTIYPIPTYSGAYSVKFKFICGDPDTDVDGTVYLDDVRFYVLGAQVPLMGSCETGSTGTFYASPTGRQVVSTTETDVSCEIPQAGVLRNLYLESDAYTTVTLRVNAGDATLSASSNSNDTTNSVTVAAGDKLALKIVNNNGTVKVRWGMEFLAAVQ